MVNNTYSITYPDISSMEMHILYKLFSLMENLKIIEDFQVGRRRTAVTLNSRYE